jgi:hypothetical protein
MGQTRDGQDMTSYCLLARLTLKLWAPGFWTTVSSTNTGCGLHMQHPGTWVRMYPPLPHTRDLGRDPTPQFLHLWGGRDVTGSPQQSWPEGKRALDSCQLFLFLIPHCQPFPWAVFAPLVLSLDPLQVPQ